MSPESQTIIDTLLAEGWKEYPDPTHRKRRLFAKNFPGYAKCHCNAPRDKQVEVYLYPSRIIWRHTIQESWSVENIGKLPDGEWLRMRIEGLNNRASIERSVWLLLQAWDHAVKISNPSPEEIQ